MDWVMKPLTFNSLLPNTRLTAFPREGSRLAVELDITGDSKTKLCRLMEILFLVRLLIFNSVLWSIVVPDLHQRATRVPTNVCKMQNWKFSMSDCFFVIQEYSAPTYKWHIPKLPRCLYSEGMQENRKRTIVWTRKIIFVLWSKRCWNRS